MKQLRQLKDPGVDEILAVLDVDGACVILDYLSSNQCNGLLSDFQPYLDGMEAGIDELGYQNDFYGSHTKRLHGLFSKSRVMEEVLTHPLMRRVTQEAFVSSDLGRGVRLSNTELMVLNPGQGVQSFHTDAASWSRTQRRESGEILISANIALTEFTSLNGATRVVPGSQHWAPEREPEDHEVCLATMPKGAALIYTGNVIHSGGDNRESAARVGLYLGYIVSWLRPIENQLVTNQPEDIFALSVEAQRLLDVSPGGFTVYA